MYIIFVLIINLFIILMKTHASWIVFDDEVETWPVVNKVEPTIVATKLSEGLMIWSAAFHKKNTY